MKIQSASVLATGTNASPSGERPKMTRAAEAMKSVVAKFLNLNDLKTTVAA